MEPSSRRVTRVAENLSSKMVVGSLVPDPSMPSRTETYPVAEPAWTVILTR